MRERTTWNRSQIAKLAAASKKAEDPRAMNQDHLKQQPSADKYTIGDPSDFAEDVHPSNGTWKAEYSGEEVKRNEIGMPEMRSDTFKTASDDEDGDDDHLEKKADVCIKLARRMLPKTASEQTIEDQALSFMHMPDRALIDTVTRLAAQEEEEEESEGQEQSKQAQGQQQDEKKQSQGQEDKGQQQAKEAQQSQGQDDKKQSQQQDEKKQSQGQEQQKKEAQGQQDEKKQSQGQQDDKESQGQEQQKKEAQDQLFAQACQAVQQGNQQLAQQLVQQLAQGQQQQMSQQQQISQQQAEAQVQQMLSQTMQQFAQGQQQQPTMADDQLLDQMLQDQQQVFAGTAPTASADSFDLQLDGPSMDTSDVKLGSEDEALTALFASHHEVREAAQAQAIQTGVPVAPMSRTASTRTVGTRPTGGVSQLGGGAGGEPSGGGEIDKLANLWQSAPDVKNVFE